MDIMNRNGSPNSAVINLQYLLDPSHKWSI